MRKFTVAVVGVFVAAALSPAVVALANRPRAVAVTSVPVEPTVITLPEVTIVAAAPSGRRTTAEPAPSAVRRAPRTEPRLVILDQGGRPGHRMVLAWDGAR